MSRYRNPDPMEKKQAIELSNIMLEKFDEAYIVYIEKVHYKPNSVLARELDQDTSFMVSKRLEIRGSQINFYDTGVSTGLNHFDTRRVTNF